ncbi:MAG: hypothetical protein CM1200mP20_04740 [Pseudomonadota bacterium]|nr:MAG: hypothetical protein CM1200mP20_04740 [Pseudomonadota bacterium]
MVQFLMTDPDVMLYHNEPIVRTGRSAVTSPAACTGTPGWLVGMGYVNNPVEKGGVDEEFVNSGRTRSKWPAGVFRLRCHFPF